MAVGSEDWRTPVMVVNLARRVFGGVIDLDPASDKDANAMIQAERYYTKRKDGLAQTWDAESVLVNPPGGTTMARKSRQAEWWHKCVSEREHYGHCIFVGFSIELLRLSQGPRYPSAMAFPLCVPRKRLRFLHPDGHVGRSPNNANAIVYVPGLVDRSSLFAQVFSELGEVRT